MSDIPVSDAQVASRGGDCPMSSIEAGKAAAAAYSAGYEHGRCCPLNLNATIRFRPTIWGRRLLPERDCPGADADGFVRMQLWVFMQKFGAECYMGATPVAEDNVIEVEGD